MKKIISLLLALVMVMGLGVTAFANGSDTKTNIPATSNASITASYEIPDASYVHTYKATVAWQQTGTIKYTDATTVYTWDTDKLEYKTSSNTESNKWTLENAKVAITVTNYSDQGITANCADPAATAPVTSISGEYDKANLSLASAYVKGGTNEAKSDTATLTINDVRGKITTDGTVIGTITVTLAIAG